jgi:hypothetical protein
MFKVYKFDSSNITVILSLFLTVSCSDTSRNETVKAKLTITTDTIKPKRNLSDTTILNFVIGSSSAKSEAHIKSLIRSKRISDKVIYQDKFLGVSFSGYKYNFPISDYNSYETLLIPSSYKGRLMKLEFLFYGSFDKMSLLSFLESKYDKPDSSFNDGSYQRYLWKIGNKRMYLSEVSPYLSIEVEHSDLEKIRDDLKSQKLKEKSEYFRDSKGDIK